MYPSADVVVRGHLSGVASRSLHRRLRELVRGGARHVRVDLSAVESLDAAGAAVILVFWRLLPPLGGGLTVVSASGVVEKALTGTGLHHPLSPKDGRVLELLGLPADAHR